MKYIEVPELARLSQALTHEGPECSVHTRVEAYSCKNITRDKRLFKSLEHAYVEDHQAQQAYSHSHSPSSSFTAVSALSDKDKDGTPTPKDKDNSSTDASSTSSAATTPFGPLDRPASRKTLYLLIATLNVAFPDHEFSDVRPAHFCKERSGAAVLSALSTTLVAPHRPGVRAPRTYSSYPPAMELFPASVPTSSSPPSTVRASPYAPPPIVSGTHPTLFRVLDESIGLEDCEVYSYVPDLASDPYAADYSDGEDDIAGSGEESSTESDEETFAFDDYDVDETARRPRAGSWRSQYEQRSTRFGTPSRRTSTDTDEGSPLRVRLRRHGSLLWSSHWFFLNRKMKRILFISICAHTKGGHQWTSDEDDLWSTTNENEKRSNERFHGWDGAVGAGARAIGLKPRSI